MARHVIGRDDELERLRAFLDANALDGPRAVVLKGDAGIGKSTLWLAGVDIARELGFRVLTSRPAEAEQTLAFAGLGDLFEDVLDGALPTLPPPRRRALEVALLLVDGEQDPLDPRALGVAVRSALEQFQEAQPLVVAVDDAQWLDASSAQALAFALRRTRAPLSVLLARRGGGSVAETTLESSLAAQSVERLQLGPLSAGALQSVIRDRLGRVFPRPTLIRIHDMSGGNPFYALEIARALPQDLDPSQPLPVPETLDQLVHARVDVLPEASQRALVLLSALGEGDTAILEKAQAKDALSEACSHGIVERKADRVRFSHPLLASSVYQGADDATRRSSHALLADIVLDPLDRARHLALAADRPDADIAASLDQAAMLASVRGAPNVAAELGELARRLTPDDDCAGRHRRAILGATAYLRAGDVGRAGALAQETQVEAADDHSRAEAVVLRSAVEAAAGSRDRAVALRREALSVAAGHPSLQAAIHQWLAENVPYSDGVELKERHARTSLDLAARIDDDFLRAGAMAVLAKLRFEAGKPDAVELAENAYALAASRAARGDGPMRSTKIAHLLAWTYDRIDLMASFVLIDILSTIGRFDAARALLDDLELELAQRDELLEAKTLWIRSLLELDAGRWDFARDLVEREQAIVALYETAQPWPDPIIARAELALHGGELDRARELAEQARELALEHLGTLANAEAVLALVDRADSELDAAVARFAAAEAAARTCGWREPTILWWRADFAEALLELSRVEDAVELLDAWESDARRLGRNRILAQVKRCRGLVAAARGDVELALATLEQAVDLADTDTDPFGRARALLALGTTRRRARQKRGAREAIEAALAAFEQLGEVIWTKRARAELGRIGGRRREDGLTPAELRVAELVVEGRTNREVAAALFLGERTVETHLSHVYAKLGIRSRTELARVYDSES